MRGMVHGLDSAVPLAHQLPAIYQEDGFTQRLCRALDTALAPILTTLDCLDSYVDPILAPADFVEMLAAWVGVAGPSAERDLVARAVDLHRRRGTVAGVQDAVTLAVGGAVTVTDSGGCTWSVSSGGPLPGSPVSEVHVDIAVADPALVDTSELEAVLAAITPAHITHRLTVRRWGAS